MEKKDTKFFVVYKDYLPEGITWEMLEKADEEKPVPLTRENLAKIVDPKYLDMTEEDFEKFIKEHEAKKSALPTTNFKAPQQRMAYAENLDENNELNQEFPEVKDE